MPPKERSHIRWGRIVVAAILSEVMVIAVLLAVFATYQYLIAPGRTAGEYEAFSELAAYWVSPAAAGVAAFLAALWVARKLSSAFIANGTLVGVVAVVLTFGLIFIAEPEERFMYGVSFLLRIIGGYLGGVAAQRMSAPTLREARP